MAKATTVANTDKTDVAVIADETQLPAFLQGHANAPEDNFDNSDIILPRIKLLQGTSPEVEAYDHAKTGMFWHSGLDVSLGDTFRFVVADRRKKYLLQAPLTDGQGILARSDDAKTWDRTGKWQVRFKGRKEPVTWEIKSLDVAKSGLTEWGTQFADDENSPPAATLFYDYLIYLPDFPEMGMVVMSVARSAIKKAKKGLNDKIAMQGQQGRPMQGLIFSAKSVDDSADGQDFKNWQFMSAGFVQSAELFEQLRSYRGALSNAKIADEGDDAARDADHAADDGEGKF